MKHTIEYCHDLAFSRGGKCLSVIYINNNSYMLWECRLGHIWRAKYNWIKTGRWCPCCAGKQISIDDCISLANLKNGECLSHTYKNINDKITWKCDKGHIWKATLNNVKNNKTWYPKCCFNAPKAQQDIEKFINDLGFATIFNDKQLISPKELDIYIPEKKIAIEYCGLYWHGENTSKNSAKNRHIDKLNMCNNIGVRLITIFEDEWLFKQEQVKNRLSIILEATLPVISSKNILFLM